VANLLVMMELYRGELLPASLEALGQARRLGTAFGLSVYALVPLPSEPDSGEEDITARCGRHGADKVVMLTGEGLQSESEMRFAGYAGALLAACAQLPPRLLLIGDTPAARDIAPRLASRLGAAFLPRGAALEVDGQLVLCDETGGHVAIDAEPVAVEGMPPPAPPPVLLTVPPGRFQTAAGSQDAEMLLVAAADTIQTSDATPVAAAGFTEEALDVLPMSWRLGGAGPAEAEAVAPPLWQVRAASQGSPDKTDAAHFHITVGPDADRVSGADYALAVPESDVQACRAALLAQLALPPPPKPIVKRVLRSGFGEGSHLTPTGELDGWGSSESTLTGDTDTTREVAVAQPPPRLHDDSAHGPSASSSRPAAGPGAAAAANAAAFDAGMWEGFATPPTSPPGTGRDDGAPQFELETADTAPVAVVAPGNIEIGPKLAPGQPAMRRAVEFKPRSSQSPRRTPPSSQSPARGRAPGGRRAKDQAPSKAEPKAPAEGADKDLGEGHGPTEDS
jgi:hypothetical protein